MNRSTDPEKIKEIVILALPNGDVVRLKDLADVKQFSEIPLKNFVNGKRNCKFYCEKNYR